MKRPAFRFAVLAVLILIASALPGSAKTVYVKWDSPGWMLDGASWDTAFHTVQAGLGAAVSGDEVWVARGTYTEWVTLASGVGLYGGFLGTETLRSQRDAEANVTSINSGGITVPVDSLPDTVVDGLTITRAQTGIRCPGSASPTISGNEITGNGLGIDLPAGSAVITGNIISRNTNGGIKCGGSPTISLNLILGNQISGNGGGIYCTGSPIIIGNRIIGNSAFKGWTGDSYGGGIYCSSVSADGLIANNAILANSAPTVQWTPASTGGGICLDASSPRILNNTLVGNNAPRGGAIGNMNGSSPVVANNIVAYNSSGVYALTPAFLNNCVFGNMAYNYGNMPDLTGQMGNISADPRLAGVSYGNWHIQPDSPCRDAGDNAYAAAGYHDLDGQARIQPEAGTVDIGADESDGAVWPDGPYAIIRVAPEGSDSNDGSTWQLAKKTAQAAFDQAAIVGGEVWVKQATYSECLVLHPYVYAYGGFVGTEAARNDRPSFPRPDPDPQASTLSAKNLPGRSVVVAHAGLTCSVLDGFTVTGGSGMMGGAVYCSGSAADLVNNVIEGNESEQGQSAGGGITCLAASPSIRNSLIRYNTTGWGGGIYFSHASPSICENTIVHNTADKGGGVYCSSDSPAVVLGNTISENDAQFGAGICCSSFAGASPLISGNTIADNGSGGDGIYCELASSPAITGNVVSGNEGKGISSQSRAAVTISENTIVENAAGGIYVQQGSPLGKVVISGNTICHNRRNDASIGGGGICCYAAGSSTYPVEIVNNLLVDNWSARYGGGIYCSGYARIINNTVVKSSTTLTNRNYGAAVYVAGGRVDIYNNIFAFNTSGVYGSSWSYNCWFENGNPQYQGPIPPTNLVADPLFIYGSTGNYHLRPDSPCVNVGSNSAPGLPANDIDGQPRIQFGSVDMGADELPSSVYTAMDARASLNGASADISGVIVTASFEGCFYIEAEDRSCGVQVEKAGYGVEAGDRVNVTGTLRTNADGERYIEVSTIEKTGTGSIRPVFINSRALGGSDWLFNPSTGAGQCGVVDGLGLNNIGLLVTTWGKLAYLGGSYSLNRTARILMEGMSLGGDTYVRITGISSCYREADGLHPTIRVTEVVPLH